MEVGDFNFGNSIYDFLENDFIKVGTDHHEIAISPY